ncbi:hypothetical protein JW710_04395 [Candidatus Dojkabacteria bacterium]|nr:hypothetical protein [Candidatus Dojkabacteria bacterium]
MYEINKEEFESKKPLPPRYTDVGVVKEWDRKFNLVSDSRPVTKDECRHATRFLGTIIIKGITFAIIRGIFTNATRTGTHWEYMNFEPVFDETGEYWPGDPGTGDRDFVSVTVVNSCVERPRSIPYSLRQYEIDFDAVINDLESDILLEFNDGEPRIINCRCIPHSSRI